LLPGLKRYLHDFRPYFDTLQNKYKSMGWLQQDLAKGFQFTKYYFPAFTEPMVVTTIEPLDPNIINGAFLNNNTLSINLMLYLRKGAALYDPGSFPEYISRRFDKEYIVTDCFKEVIERRLYPFTAYGRSLIEQMIEKGKQWWLLDKLLPEVADTLKTAYTAAQLKGCVDNEGIVWNHFSKEVNLYTIETPLIQAYIGESPFTQAAGFGMDSPGNIGPWVGWQIIKAYEAKHPDIKPAELLRMDAKTLFTEARYKPK
jgi:hypothetical protein